MRIANALAHRALLGVIGLAALLPGAAADPGPQFAGGAPDTAAPRAGAGTPSTSPARAVETDSRRPNILFIMIDTLRADRLGCYGHPDRLTPVMDALAEEGVLFERGIAPCPWTLPSVASCFTGVFPTAHGANGSHNLPGAAPEAPRRILRLPAEFTTLAECLQAAGYDTAAISANPYVRSPHGFAQGFGYFSGKFARNSVPGSRVNRFALAWLDRRWDRQAPFFLYLHYMDVHGPYTTADWKYVEPQVEAVRRLTERTSIETFTPLLLSCRRRYEDRPDHRDLFRTAEYWAALYTAGVPQMDEYLGELREHLRYRGLWDDTYIILAGDHGEALYENGIWGHGLSAHQNQLHVPVILRWPDVLPAAKRVSQAVSLIDLMPTLLEQLGIDPPPGLQGRSLAPVMAGETPPERPLIAEAIKVAPHRKALVLGQWKLLGDVRTGEFELFDNAADPWDQRDVAADHPDRVRALRRELDKLLAQNRRIAAAVAHEDVELSPEDAARLRALGYLDDENDAAPSDRSDSDGEAPNETGPHDPQASSPRSP